MFLEQTRLWLHPQRPKPAGHGYQLLHRSPRPGRSGSSFRVDCKGIEYQKTRRTASPTSRKVTFAFTHQGGYRLPGSQTFSSTSSRQARRWSLNPNSRLTAKFLDAAEAMDRILPQGWFVA